MPPARRSARTVSNPVTAARESSEPYSRTNARVVSSTASVARAPNGKTSLRLTVKAPPSKLRQATSGSALPPNPYADNQSESDATPAPPRRAARATRNPRTVVDHDSDEMDEDQDAEGDGEEEDDDEVEEEVEEEIELARSMMEDSEEDAEGEEDEDEDMDDHPPPPVITRTPATGKGKAQTVVSAAPAGTLKSVEAKEVEDEDEDEELSELDSPDDDELEGNDEEDEDDEDDSDDDDENSRSATPDLSKLTKRQRGAIVEFEGAESTDLMALSNEALKKKHLTAEEHVQRRAEMARRRKNLSEKKNEEEKMETINKLLHKQAPKRRTRAEMEAARAAETGETPAAERDTNALDPAFVRWVGRKEGSIVCIPPAWQESPAGELFGFKASSGGRMVEEVQ